MPPKRSFSRRNWQIELDWRYLKAQIAIGLEKAEFENVRVDAYGIRCEASIPIVGRNDRVAVVKTAWIVRADERASLITAFPGVLGDKSQERVIKPPVVDAVLSGDARWAAIFKLADDAGRMAHDQSVPTPMRVVGYPVIMDGMCGGAYIRVPDARRDFARWLLKNGHAWRGHLPGAMRYFSSNTQSVDRARAYAEAFAGVLCANGVECSVTTYLD